ncbi:P35 lipoprotein promoter DNA invertase [Malacoplasma penetrans]|uniref:Recombinase n=1 Tax=Malacoplasma penetrans (strain HF-2) TaxID=272633 RepID=Q8EWB4_MALP2|nr:P35 lipoprotein promoter DNA invertase [Malacoplasma penetrans]BAC44082.1 recombinase [Malacoplasma penetrans HF-2]
MEKLKKFKEWLINIKGYSPKTIEVYCKYAHFLIENDENYFITMEKYKHTTNNSKRIILSSFKKYYEFTDDKRREEIELPKKEKRVQDYVTYDEYIKIIDFIKNHKSSNMSLAIIRLLFETGIRSAELLNIKTSDIYKNRIRIYGKNRLERFIYVCDSLEKILNQLVKKRNKENVDKVFPITYKALYKRVRNLSKKVNKKLSPHMFRRGFATHCIGKNIGIYQISLMMGHENINTTKNYIKCSYSEEMMSSIFK